MNHRQELQLESELTNAHRAFEKGLLAYASFKLSDPAKGEDLVQETFLKTWTYLSEHGKVDLMKAFLYHVLNDLIIDEYRKRKVVSLDALLENGYDPATENPERLFDVLDGTSAMHLIHRLPYRYQRVMRMRYVENLSLSEIAAITGQTKNTVSVQVHRGLEKLRVLHDSPPG